MNKILSFLAVILMVTLLSCESGTNSKMYEVNNPNLRAVKILDIVQTTNYTYLEMKEEGAVYWGAIPRNENIVKGNTYYFDSFMEMKNFASKELDKTFESVYFIEVIKEEPFAAAAPPMMEQKGTSKVSDMEVEMIEAVEGSTSISDLYLNKADLAGKKVKVHGKVVKFTSGVMGKNWVHIQDGSRTGDLFDLTITTDGVCDIGDVASFEGVIVLDKDFGYGYAYDVLMEDAVMTDFEPGTSLQ